MAKVNKILDWVLNVAYILCGTAGIILLVNGKEPPEMPEI